MSVSAPEPGSEGGWPGPERPPRGAAPPVKAPSGAAPPGPPQQAAPPDPAASFELQRTRTGTAYVASIVAIVVAILVIVFIVQNLHEATVHFLAWTIRLPQGVTILASAVAGALTVLLISLARILQLRMTARRHRRHHRAQGQGQPG